jgi:metal-responsive CopG/Arc/MetJ family transcriptional regulator
MSNRRQKRSSLIGVWMPDPMKLAIDRAVASEDSDRSKFIRKAVKERIRSLGIEISEDLA